MPTGQSIATEQEMADYARRMQMRNAPAWMPEPDTTIVVECVGVMRGSTDEYGEYPIVVYQLGNGALVSVHAFHTILRERLRELKTAPGSRQILTYLGRKSSRSRMDAKGNPVEYHHYYAENVGEETSATVEIDI